MLLGPQNKIPKWQYTYDISEYYIVPLLIETHIKFPFNYNKDFPRLPCYDAASIESP